MCMVYLTCALFSLMAASSKLSAIHFYQNQLLTLSIFNINLKKHKNFWSWIDKGVETYKSTQKLGLFKCFSSLFLEQQDRKQTQLGWENVLYWANTDNH